jgi:toxin-antitoxin system PIN domain toxin
VSVSLLDVNVLVALFDPAHQHHESAHRWLGRNAKRGWATSQITVSGCVRVLSNPKYPTVDATPSEVIEHLRIFCSLPHHEFWGEGYSLIDTSLFRIQAITGHQMLTDVCLLGLAVRRHGKLVTFDRSISVHAVVGAAPANLEVIGEAA